SLSVTGNSMKRQGAGVPLHYTVTMPYDNYFLGADTAEYLEQFFEDRGSGVDLPAAVILETVQGEGGLQAARNEWLRKIADICKRWDMLLIIDDVQAGCGRTGTFFSFEQAKIEPDIVCLSKSISGSGLPMALTLIKPEHDRWQPGEHNGTFRGNNLAFITAAVALEYWKTEQFSMEIREKAALVTKRIADILDKYPQLQGEARGRGLMQGIAIPEEGLAQKISKQAFRCGLILETSGPKDEVLKFLPPLIIDNEGLHEGLDIVEQCMKFVLSK
ncbi:MAG TPA: aminotransferase class III-fold pyridoxal phosphate-dependent enzyme, partial [Bacillota bacterium]|nr:aminotransferase class III-fold pyridoxal phosphate-dependent enzyme [Bacillota bacterium]